MNYLADTYKQFKQLSYYETNNFKEYNTFPFNFKFITSNKVLLVNDEGEFLICKKNQFLQLINKSIDFEKEKKFYLNLLKKQFIYLKEDKKAIQRKATKYRTKKSFLYSGPILHIFVITTRCQHKCHYCQITPQNEKNIQFDMKIEIAKKAVEIMMNSPSKSITVEFQGGEPLLAFYLVEEIVSYVLQLNKIKNKEIQFVLSTTLVDINEKQLEFIKTNNIVISTSLDGPEDLHNFNRPINSTNTYKKYLEGFNLTKKYIPEAISPLLTISRKSLNRTQDIIEEYIKFGENSISLRPLSPYGFAAKTMSKIGYTTEEYIEFYLKSLDYIIEMNLKGIYFREEYATILLKKILTPFATNYVDLQSPSGAGINVFTYHYNGNVYPSDEARMIASMGDESFLLGNVLTSTYHDIFNNPILQVLIQDSCLESLTECSECVFLPYCGSDPFFNYVTQKDHYGHRPSSSFCVKQKAILNYLFQFIINNDQKVLNIFWSWIHYDIKTIRDTH